MSKIRTALVETLSQAYEEAEAYKETCGNDIWVKLIDRIYLTCELNEAEKLLFKKAVSG